MDFSAILDAAPHPYILLDTEFVIVWANKAYLETTGRSLADLGGRNMFDAFPPGPHDPAGESARQLRTSLERVLTSRKPDTLALIRYAIPDASLAGRVFEDRYWSATHTPIFGRDGELRFILQQTDDVTELQRLKEVVGEADHGFQEQMDRLEAGVFKRAQAVQEESRSIDSERRHLRELFVQAPGFVAFLRGPQHLFELANNSYYEIVGHRELIGKPVREALPEVERQGFVDLLDRVFETGEPFLGREVQVVLDRDPGAGPTGLYLDFVFQPITGPDGAVCGIFIQGHDVTERTRAREELQRYRDRLEDLVRERTRALEESEAERRQAEAALRQSQKMEAIGKLTGGVAHDFNNLLQVISGNLQLLSRRAGTEDARRLESAVAAVRRGAKLASQLLAFARRHPLEPKAVDLSRLVRNMDDLLRRVLGDAIEIETVIAGGLWNTMADPDQVENAILNLAVNARDAMDGAGKLTIEAGNAMLDDLYVLRHADVSAGQYVMLAISDTGCGMPPEVAERAFDPFFTTKPEGQGTGLGLSMVYGFVKQSGGHVKIYSEPGSGTTVRIYLPRTHRKVETDIEPRPGPVEKGTETILVVEDDPAVRATVVDMLTDLGYRVLKATDAQSALAIVRSGIAIDLLFTDVVMPGPVRSPELARQARQLLPDLAVLFTSGYTENAIVHGGRLDPGVNLLSKPYRQEELARKLRQVLRRAGTERAAPSRPGTLRVLLVEDDLIIRESTEEMLKELGHSVTAEGDAERALSTLELEEFDVLFTDVGLPGLSGTGLAAKALDLRPGLRVIYASGYGDPADADPAGRNARATLLPKPYDLADMEKALREATGN